MPHDTVKPLIGILSVPGGVSERGTRDLMDRAGGKHINLDYEAISASSSSDKIRKVVTEQIKNVNYIILPGNHYDVNPQLYGQSKHLKTNINPDPRRERFERELIRQANDKGIPMFGICGGYQHMVVRDGGTLSQHVEGHNQEEKLIPLTKPSHSLEITTGTELDAIRESAGIKDATVNSFHHQAVETTGRSLKVSASAPDGVIEAVESKIGGMKPTWGVQFHPELIAKEKFSDKIATAILDGAKTHAAKILVQRQLKATVAPTRS